MKRRFALAVAQALALGAAFGIGFYVAYFVMWSDTFTKFMEMADRVFK